MSFGYSVGDFITILRLANDLRKRFADAPKQLKVLSEDIRLLSIVLQDVDDVVDLSDRISDQRQQELGKISKSCQDVLEDLKHILDKNQEMTQQSTSSQKVVKMRVAWKRLRWDEKEVDGFRKRLSLSITAFNAFLQYLTVGTTLDIKADVVRLHKRQDHQERDAEHLKILNWFSTNDHSSKQRDVLKARQAGTGQWLLDSDEFQDWVSQTGKTILCPGIPGAGKTILTSIVIDHLQEKYRNDDSVGIAYLFFTYQPKQEQAVEALLGSLTRQLLESQNKIPDDIEGLYKIAGAGNRKATVQDLVRAVQICAKAHSRVFILLDALDECFASTPVGLNSILSNMFDLQRATSFSLFATSRHISDITSQFLGSIHKEIRAHEDDVSIYIDSRMQDLLRSRISKHPNVQDLVRSQVLKATDGMFLLARLHMDSLMGQPTVGNLKRALNTLPQGSRGLDETYDRAMQRIEDQEEGDRDLAKRILTWVIFARRTLSVDELLEALAIEPGTTELDEDFRPEVETLDSLCAGLVTVDENTDVVRLVHYTTQEYFERKSHAPSSSPFPNAHADISEACITYLSFESFSNGTCADHQSLDSRLRDFPLYSYAAMNWGEHTANTMSNISEDCVDFLRAGSKVASCTQVILSRHHYERSYVFGRWFAITVSGLHLASFFGLHVVFTQLISGGQSPHSKDSMGRSVLWYAACNGKPETVRALLQEHKVDPNVTDDLGRTALLMAVNEGSWDAVKELLRDPRTDPNYGGDHNDKALHEAIRRGSNQIMTSLLEDERIDPNVEGWRGATAIHLAIEAKDVNAIEKLLQNKRLDVCALGQFADVPLMAATREGLHDIVELLLGDPRCDPNAQDHFGWTALTRAAWVGNERIVKLLLANEKVDPNLKDEDGQTAFHQAAVSSAAIVRLFIAEEGPNPDAPGISGRTPLSFAAENGKFESVHLLLGSGRVSPDFKDSIGRTPLFYAASRGFVDIVELLIRKGGADPDTRNKYGQTPLSNAAERGDKDTVQFLLATDGVDPDGKDNTERTPLLYAAMRGYMQIVELLLGTGRVEPDKRDVEGRTPLSYAAENGDVDMLKLLLDTGEVKPDSRDTAGRTPFSYAVENENLDMMKLLLSTGEVEPDGGDIKGRTPFSYAASVDGVGVMEFLLAEHGVDLDAEAVDGRTPLYHAICNRSTAAAEFIVIRASAKVVTKTILDHIAEQEANESWEDARKEYARIRELLEAKLELSREVREDTS